jgi:type III restriction enzyme
VELRLRSRPFSSRHKRICQKADGAKGAPSRSSPRRTQGLKSVLTMSNPFFDHPIINSPYEYPKRHWELDSSGQPTQRVIERRRPAEFITPIPKPKKRKPKAAQPGLVFDEGKGLSTKAQQYDPTSIINEVRQQVTTWRELPRNSWQVTPESTRLLEHWRHHNFAGVRPFFCQIEAVETAIWLTEVAPHLASGKRILELLAAANRDANPQLQRVALKLATGAGKTTVMAMLIAWQTVNAGADRPVSTSPAASSSSRRASPLKIAFGYSSRTTPTAITRAANSFPTTFSTTSSEPRS